MQTLSNSTREVEPDGVPDWPLAQLAQPRMESPEGGKGKGFRTSVSSSTIIITAETYEPVRR